MQAHCSGKGGKGPVDTPGIGTVGGGKAGMGPGGPLACTCACDRSSSATRWRSMRSSRRSCNATFTETTYSNNAPNKHEISSHKPIGNGGVCQTKKDSCATVTKEDIFSITSTVSVPPNSTITRSII